MGDKALITRRNMRTPVRKPENSDGGIFWGLISVVGGICETSFCDVNKAG
jgi:hypothetical protein